MRHAPTSGFVIAALLVGAGILGCAADATEPDGRDLSPTASGSATSNDDGADDAPAFTAQFANDGGTTDASTPTTTGGTCTDPGDPGATEPLAQKLDDTDDCNDDLIARDGTLLTAVDVDMYKLSAKDKTFCSLDTKFEAATAGTQLCVFARCQNSTANPVTGCKAGGTEATSDLGWKGCCATGPGEATPTWDCSGISDNDSAEFFVRVKSTTPNSCVKYTFKYRF